jgi:hypothetical protein
MEASVSDAARKRLFVTSSFTPTLQTDLADAVVALGKAAGTSGERAQRELQALGFGVRERRPLR